MDLSVFDLLAKIDNVVINCRLARLSATKTRNSLFTDGYIFGDEHEKYYVRLRVEVEFSRMLQTGFGLGHHRS